MKQVPLLMTFIWLCGLFPMQARAQAAPDSVQFEIGTGIPFFPIGWGGFNNFRPQALNISAKIIYKKNALRLGATLVPSHFTEYYILNAGYERRFLPGKFQLLAGADLGYACFPRNYIYPKEFWRHYGIGPVVGWAYQPLRSLSIQMEWGMFIGKGKYDYETEMYTAATYHRWFGLGVYYCFR